MNERELLKACYPLVVHAANTAPDIYAGLKKRIDVALSHSAPAKQEQAEAEQLARSFHESYERLAPQFGYETRTETRQFDPTTKNGRLMIAVCQELLNEMRNTSVLTQTEAGELVRRLRASGDECACYADEALSHSNQQFYARLAILLRDAAALLAQKTETQQEEGLVTEIDLDAEAWAQIKEAARVSLWMPPNYMMNDWVSDVCGFLHGCEDPLSPQSGKEGKSADNPLLSPSTFSHSTVIGKEGK